MEYIAENYRRIVESVQSAAARVGRDPEAVHIIAVSKTQPVEAIQAALTAGVEELGENRVQDALPKVEAVGHGPRWHFIGHLQTNKASKVAPAFDVVHGVDSVKLAEALNRHVPENTLLEVLVQVNTSGEASKFGCDPDAALELMDRAGAFQNLRLRGLMTIGPLTEARDAVTASFARLRKLLEEAQRQHIGGGRLDMLSMGMSSDYDIAIAEGATHVRIGTAVFGPRLTR